MKGWFTKRHQVSTSVCCLPVLRQAKGSLWSVLRYCCCRAKTTKCHLIKSYQTFIKCKSLPRDGLSRNLITPSIDIIQFSFPFLIDLGSTVETTAGSGKRRTTTWKENQDKHELLKCIIHTTHTHRSRTPLGRVWVSSGSGANGACALLCSRHKINRLRLNVCLIEFKCMAIITRCFCPKRDGDLSLRRGHPPALTFRL